MSGPIVNQFGRRGGRGIRPWLVAPKVLAVGTYLGGVACAISIWLELRLHHADKDDPIRAILLAQFGRLFLTVIVPALLATMAVGVLMFLQHPRVFLRQRWWQVKIVCVILGVPALHLYMSSRFWLLEDSVRAGVWNDAAQRQIDWGLAALTVWSIGVALLGRLKPRLGQNPALALLAAGAALTLVGCDATGGSQRLAPTPAPPDFALEFYAEGQSPARYVLEVGRTMRAQTGPLAQSRTYPPAVGVLRRQQVESILAHVRRYHLLAEPTSPGSESSTAPVKHHVTITAWGRTHRYTTTPEESPPTDRLRRMLEELARTPGEGWR